MNLTLFFEGLCMKISELIKELEGMLEKWGDLEVVKGRDYVGSEEVTGITTIHGDCYIENKYLDNYTMRNEDKLACVKKDLEKILKGYDCLDCRNQLEGYCHWNKCHVKGRQMNIKCFEAKDMPYEKQWKINMMQNCIHKLEYELRQANEY